MKIEDVGLKFPKPLAPLKRVDKIIVHHPAHPTWDIHDIHNSHIKGRGFNGIGYNYFVTRDGRVQKGRGRNQGAHCLNGWNSKSLGVSFQGNFEIQTPTEVQYRAGAALIAQLILDEGINIHDVDGHGAFDETLCPGKNFDMNKLRSYILEVINPKTKVDPAPKVEVKSEVITKPSKGGRTLVKNGDRGQIVKTIQTLVGASADGIFGPNTEAKVKAFQKREGLSQDGIVGKNSWRALTGDKGGLLH